MIRVAEIALFAAPFALYGLWRTGALDRLAPSRIAIAVSMAGLVAMGAALAWDGVHERHPEGSRYVPATLQGGQVVPGHDD